MKKLILLIAIILIVFAVYNRQRLYVRDPLANVTRDGVKEPGAQVYINYSNDVLLENNNPPAYATLIQKAQPVGTPKKLYCIQWLVCMAEAYPAPLVALDADSEVESMSFNAVNFKDRGKETLVVLR